MNTIKTTPEFDKWFSSIKDNVTLLRLTHRLKKVAAGNLGDIKPVGEGVWEMREFFGNGWRMYYTQKGDVIILMLGGGDKSTQSRDISQAIALTKLIKE
jgi:putative addiction module killer protein